MTTQYLRNCSLVVAKSVGAGIELGKFRVVFEVKRGSQETPNSLDARIYNLAPSTVSQLQASSGAIPEFVQVSLSVSYGTAPPARIFWGAISQIRAGREDQRNSYLDITAADGDENYNFSVVSGTLAAGATPMSHLQSLLAAMARSPVRGVLPTTFGPDGQPVLAAYVPPVIKNDTTQSIRGRSYYGDVKDQLRQFAEDHDLRWSIQDGVPTFIPKTGYIPEAPVLITPSTGLIGVPETTQTGLRVRVLLNPAIKIGRLIKLQSTDINRLRYGLDLDSISDNLFSAQGATKVNADGLYLVYRVDHTGDTRGVPWYSDLTCLAVDASTIPQSVTASTVISGVVPRY